MKRKGALRAGVLYCSRAGKIFASLSEGDLQELRSTLAGFAEKRVRWHFREKITEGGCKAKCTGVIKKGAFRKHRFFYVLSFLKRKYERKQFRRHILLKDHLKKFKAGFLCYSDFNKSKGESAARILKCF